jgi:transposase
MAYRPLVSDDLWEAIEPLLPRRAPQPKGGRPWVSDRAALGGIIFVLQTGLPWKRLPTELGYGSGTTCWRRVREWQAAGVWERLHRVILNWLGDAGAIDWDRASDRAAHASVRPSSTPTRRTTSRAAAPTSADAGSGAGSPARASNPPSASVGIAGRSNARSPGSPATVASPPATSAAPISSPACSTSPAPSPRSASSPRRLGCETGS